MNTHPADRKVPWEFFYAIALSRLIRSSKGKKLINDTAFACRYISHKLQQKHVSREAIQTTLEDIMGDEAQKALASKAAASWRKSHPKHATDKNRLTRFLCYPVDFLAIVSIRFDRIE